jgi:hypothetical protein
MKNILLLFMKKKFHKHNFSSSPLGIQIWINLAKKEAAYQGAKCNLCGEEKWGETVFSFSSVPDEQICGKLSPFQMTKNGNLWISADYFKD